VAPCADYNTLFQEVGRQEVLRRGRSSVRHPSSIRVEIESNESDHLRDLQDENWDRDLLFVVEWSGRDKAE
jgi:hypothetical protein